MAVRSLSSFALPVDNTHSASRTSTGVARILPVISRPEGTCKAPLRFISSTRVSTCCFHSSPARSRPKFLARGPVVGVLGRIRLLPVRLVHGTELRVADCRANCLSNELRPCSLIGNDAAQHSQGLFSNWMRNGLIPPPFPLPASPVYPAGPDSWRSVSVRARCLPYGTPPSTTGDRPPPGLCPR